MLLHCKIVACYMYVVSQRKTLSPDLMIYLVWISSVRKFTLVSWRKWEKDEVLSYLLQMAVTTWTFCLLLKYSGTGVIENKLRFYGKNDSHSSKTMQNIFSDCYQTYMLTLCF